VSRRAGDLGVGGRVEQQPQRVKRCCKAKIGQRIAMGRSLRRAGDRQPSLDVSCWYRGRRSAMAENRYLQPMTDWPPIILTAIGSGAVGSIITTYGTQTRERRQARAQAREAIRQVQNSAYPVPTQEQLTATLDNLETSAMLAGLPKNLIAINREAIYIRRGVMESVATASPPTVQASPRPAATWPSPPTTSQARLCSSLSTLPGTQSSALLTDGGAPVISPASWTHARGPAPANATSAAGNANTSAKLSEN
jgi:hypothetical protein